MLKTMLVEDETLSLKALKIMLQPYKDVLEIVGSYSSPIEALQDIYKLSPDLVFLDIEMPKLNGFEFLDRIQNISFNVIFTTAHDEFAIKAFKYSAVGYLVKPIDADDLKMVIKKIQSAEIKKLLPVQIEILRQAILDTISIKEQKVGLPVSDGVLFVSLMDIIRCESDNNYTKVFFTNRDKILICKTLKDIEELLGEPHFFRVHQSHLVNMNNIKQYIKSDGGYLVMSDKTEVPISRNKKDDFLIKYSSYFS
jgi:two-component system LytT family response regulator